MTEVLDDIRVSCIEITGDRGLNFSSEETRIKHTGEGEFEMLSYGNIEIKTELKPYRRYDDDPPLPINEELGNIEIEALNQITIEAEGEDTEESVALTIEAENGSIEIEAKQTIEITAESNEEDAIEIEAENGGIKIHAEGCETGNIEIEAKLSIEISADANDEEAIEIEAENGGISIKAGEETNSNGVIEIVAYSSDCEAIEITAVNGGIKIKTEACGNDIKIITQENDSVIIPHTLKAGEVHQSYDPQSEPTGPYALLVPTGAIMPYAGSGAPGGWLFCTGATYLVSTYPTLHNVLSYTYGGTNDYFAVPDLRSRLPLGAGQYPGLSNRILSQMGGQEGITHVPPHRHYYNEPTFTQSNDTTNVSGIPHNDYSIGTNSVQTSSSGDNIESPSVDVMNPFLVLNYIIKV